MALRIVAHRPDPAIVSLPWSMPLEEWPEDVVVPLPRGLSRHVVRFVRLGDRIYAVKETQEPIALREYSMLRDIQRAGMPSVSPQAVVTGRTTADGEELPTALVTNHLRFSLPYRVVFERYLQPSLIPSLVDALVILLVRLHLAGFYWGDVSLSNVLFRRDAGGYVAYLVDAETSEHRPEISRRLREYDVQVGRENVFAEICDLIASRSIPADTDANAVTDLIHERYTTLWSELTAEESFSTQEMWRIERRIERLNELGFDVQELDIRTAGDTVHLQPVVVEAGHYQRQLRELTGIEAEDAQARRMLNDIAQFTVTRDLVGLEKSAVARRWLRETYQPIIAMAPDEEGELSFEPAQLFHEILVHRIKISDEAGHRVRLLDAAQDYFDHVYATAPSSNLRTNLQESYGLEELGRADEEAGEPAERE